MAFQSFGDLTVIVLGKAKRAAARRAAKIQDGRDLLVTETSSASGDGCSNVIDGAGPTAEKATGAEAPAELVLGRNNNPSPRRESARPVLVGKFAAKSMAPAIAAPSGQPHVRAGVIDLVVYREGGHPTAP